MKIVFLYFVVQLHWLLHPAFPMNRQMQPCTAEQPGTFIKENSVFSERLGSLEFIIPAFLSSPVITQRVTNLPRPNLLFEIPSQDVKYFVLGSYYLFMDFLSVTIRLRPYSLNINMPIFFGTDDVEQKIDFCLLFVSVSGHFGLGQLQLPVPARGLQPE